MNGVKIQQFEGAEILKNNIEKRIIKRDYKAVMPNSPLLNKLIDSGLSLNKDKDRTPDIVQVTFNYGYTTQEIKALKKQMAEINYTIKCNVADKKKALEDRKLQSGNKDKAPFTKTVNSLTADNKDLRTEKKDIIDEIKNKKMDANKVREQLYTQGFSLDYSKYDKDSNEWKVYKTIEYIYWFRTTAKSRVGDTLFINKKFLNDNKIDVWQNMGIELPEMNAKVVENEAYKGLTASAVEKYITLNPKTNILVVDDLESWSNKLCCKVYVEDGICKTKNAPMDIKNILWDGLALADDSLYSGSEGMMTLRQHYFKACAFRTYISKFMQDWCKQNGKDYETATVPDRYGNAIKVSKILMITTENAMKWEKLGKTYDDWCDAVIADDCKFGVTKVDHPSKYRGYQRMSYQMLQSLPGIDTTNVNVLCADTVKYVNSLKNKNDIHMFLDFLDINKSELNANQMYIDLVKHNPDFAQSDMFCKFRSKTISDYKKQLRAGKLLQNAENLTVCGNPYLLLKHAVGDLKEYIKDNKIVGYTDTTLPVLESGISVYTKRFAKNEQLTGFRNPQNAPHNILYLINSGLGNKLLEEYFNFSKNIIAINMVQTDAQDRANGMDEDSDFIYCCNSDLIVQSSIKAQSYPTIVNAIPQSKKNYDNTMLDRATIDNGLAKGKYDIGLTSNLAAIALSWYWKAKADMLTKTNEAEIKMTKSLANELEEVVAICSVLAQCAIDNSKRKYEVVISSEIKRIRNLPCMQVKKDGKTAKPYFWQFVKDCKAGDKKLSYYDLALEQLADKYKLSTKEYKLLKYNKSEINIIVNEYKKDKYKANNQIKSKSSIKNADKKKEKQDDIKQHCLTEKLCVMDFIQSEIDKISNAWSNKKCNDDMDFIVKVKGKAETKQMKKILPIVNELDSFYKFNKDNEDISGEETDEKWLIEQRLKVDEIMDKLKKFTPTPKTMQMLILSAFEGNKHYKQRLLNCLYNLNPDRFLECFKIKM